MITFSKGHSIGKSTKTTIAGADFRMLRVTIAAPSATIIPHTVPPRAPSKVWHKLPRGVGGGSIQEFVQRRPGFNQLFDGILLDSSYLSTRSESALEVDAAWAKTRQLSLGVDLSPAINMFPGLRLGNFTGSTSPPPWQCAVCANGLFYNRWVGEGNVFVPTTIDCSFWFCYISTSERNVLLLTHAVPFIIR